MTETRKNELYCLTSKVVDYDTFDDLIEQSKDAEEKEYIRRKMMEFYHREEASADMI